MTNSREIYKQRFELIKAVTKELRKKYKGIQANSYGFCCNSDYDSYHKYINDNDYVCAKIYKGGLNNDFVNGLFVVDREVYFSWNLTTWAISEICETMREVARHKADIVEPDNPLKCITLVFKK